MTGETHLTTLFTIWPADGHVPCRQARSPAGAQPVHKVASPRAAGPGGTVQGLNALDNTAC